MINFEKDKLLCMLIMNDDLARDLGLPHDAFWVGFVLQERTSGLIYAAYRFKQSNGEKSWHSMKPNPEKQRTMEELVEGLIKAVMMLIEKVIPGSEVKMNEPVEAISAYYPPDDNGDTEATLAWLFEHDLVEASINGVPTTQMLPN